MLSVRSPLVLDMQKNYEARNADTVHLLKEGTYYIISSVIRGY